MTTTTTNEPGRMEAKQPIHSRTHGHNHNTILFSHETHQIGRQLHCRSQASVSSWHTRTVTLFSVLSRIVFVCWFFKGVLVSSLVVVVVVIEKSMDSA